jgi:hypothetical protein
MNVKSNKLYYLIKNWFLWRFKIFIISFPKHIASQQTALKMILKYFFEKDLMKKIWFQTLKYFINIFKIILKFLFIDV